MYIYIYDISSLRVNASIYTEPNAQSKYTFYNDFFPQTLLHERKKSLKTYLKEEPRTQDSRQGRLLDIRHPKCVHLIKENFDLYEGIPLYCWSLSHSQTDIRPKSFGKSQLK